MTEEELQRMVRDALTDLEATGMHWIPDGYAKAVCKAVQEHWPDRVIMPHEPEPWDEWVIVDHTNEDVSIGQLPLIAANRKADRDRHWLRR